MSTTIDTIFEKGVFRPLKPVAIAENRRVTIRVEEVAFVSDRPASFEPLPIGEYHPDALGEDFEFETVPFPEITKLRVRFVFAGELLPAPYPED